MNAVNVAKITNDTKVFNQVLNLKRYYTSKWWNTSKKFPRLNNQTNYWYKRIKEKENDKFIKEFVRLIEQYPTDEDERKMWKYNVNTIIDTFISESDLISMEDKNLLLNQGLLQISKEFVTEARNFDSSLSIEDIGQAMRNVWIMNIIQMLLGKRIELTPSIFSYSMLYPYTDNYLDNKDISKEEKKKTCHRFGKRLEGHLIEPINKYEERIFELVNRIEGEYDRGSYPMVFESLLAIHKAQIKSLQQQGQKTGPYEEDILGISVEKGGTSILADAYLVNGRLTEEEAIFFFGYGVLLQICDDLQDGKYDLKNGHMTIVSQLATKWKLDNITNRLINFTFDIVDKEFSFKCAKADEMKELIRKNCLQLILFSVARNRNLYSRIYFNEIKKYFPFRQGCMIKMYKTLNRRFLKLDKSYNGVDTEEIMMKALS